MRTKIKKILLRNKILILLVLLNLVLSCIGINFGLPHLWEPDEMQQAVTRMLSTKTLNPGRFIYPSVVYYSLLIVNVPYAFYLLITGKSAIAFTDPVLKAQAITFVTLTSRVLTAIIGSIGIILIYLLAKNIANKRAAIIAAAFASVNMALITYSHFATSDLPVTVLSTLALLFIMRAYDKPNTKNYILAGICIGLATGAKYYAIMLAVILFAAHILSHKKLVIDKKLFLAGVFCIITFLITTPFSVLDFKTFYRDIAVLSNTRKTVSNFYDPVTGLSYLFHLDNGLGTLLLLLSIISILHYLLFNRQKKLHILFAWIAIYYISVSIMLHFTFLRYILPIIPGIIIFAGIFSDYLLSRYKTISLVLIACLFIFNFAYAVKTDSLFINDSRYSATDWIKSNIPKNAKILVFINNDRYTPMIATKTYLDLVSLENYTTIVNSLENESPDYIIDSSLYYDRYITYSQMYPKRSPLPRLFGYITHYPGITEFYHSLFEGKLGYSIIKKFPDERADVPDPEFINPTIVVFKNNGP